LTTARPILPAAPVTSATRGLELSLSEAIAFRL
jgi:hypothetical protein